MEVELAGEGCKCLHCSKTHAVMTLKSITTRPETFSNSTLTHRLCKESFIIFLNQVWLLGTQSRSLVPFEGAQRKLQGREPPQLQRSWDRRLSNACIPWQVQPAQFLLHKRTLPGSDAIDVIDGAWRGQMARGCLLEPAGVWCSFLPWRIVTLKKENGMLSILMSVNSEVGDSQSPLLGAACPHSPGSCLYFLAGLSLGPGSPKAALGFGLLSGCLMCRRHSLNQIQPFVFPEAAQSSL